MNLSAVQGRSRTDSRLCIDTFGHILSFLEPKDLACSERVCKSWDKFIHGTDQWKRQCQIQLGLSFEIDPKKYLPEALSYKKSLQLMFASILGERVYELYIGKVGPIPRIPEGLSLKRWNLPDPCNPTTTVGKQYVWMYIPSHIETVLKGFSLDKADDSKDPEAPKLIRRESSLEAQSENTTLKVPVTINNIRELFERPKTGNSSTYAYIWDPIIEQHGNKRVPAGWVCIRRDVIGRGLKFNQQQALANEKEVALSELLPRILVNFLEHSRSKEVDVYLDRQTPYTYYARTSTLTRDSGGNNQPSACGHGCPSGLYVTHYYSGNDIGVAVELPAEDQSIGS